MTPRAYQEYSLPTLSIAVTNPPQQTVAMATRTSFGTSQSPAWQDGVLFIGDVPRPGFLCWHSGQQDSGHLLLPPDLPAQRGLAGAACVLLGFIAFCHHIKEKDSRISPKQFPPSGQGIAAGEHRIIKTQRKWENTTKPEAACER